MRTVVSTSLVIASFFIASFCVRSVAHAQEVLGDPTIVLTPTVFPDTQRRISVESLSGGVKLNFKWTIQGGTTASTYSFKIRYGSATGPLVRMSNPNELSGYNLNSGQLLLGEVREFDLTPDQILWSTDEEARAPFEGDRTIVVHVFRPGEEIRDNPNTGGWTFKVDIWPPPPPTLVSLSPGERRMGASWVAPKVRAGDVKTYEIVYCPSTRLPVSGDLELSTGSSTKAGSCDAQLDCEVGLETKGPIDIDIGSASIDSKLANGVPVAVAVRSMDDLGNAGECSNVLVAAPTETIDFFELYRERGGGEDGGFCFVATAAHGSYAHPTVRLLRIFRDDFLSRTPWGAALVRAYYERSPPLAEEIRHDASTAWLARVLLLPTALGGVFLVSLPLFGVLSLGLLIVRRRRGFQGGFRPGFRGGRQGRGQGRWPDPSRSRGDYGARTVLVLVALGLASGSAHAARPESTLPVGVGLEFKGGPYLPRVTDQGRTETTESAFREIFKASPRPLFSLGLDLQLYRGFGSAGIAGSFGFMQFVGKSVVLRNDALTRSDDTTVFNILPLDLVAFYRFDWLADQIWFPLVPYAKGGLAYHVWWVTTAIGHVSRDDGDPADPNDDAIGRGGKLGLTGTLGVALLLNALDSGSARSLFNSTSIRGTYIFFEAQAKKADGFGGRGFDLSDTTWNLGFYLEI